MIKVYPDGTIIHSLRITAKASCHLALHFYPVDSQECDLRLLSYSHPVEELALHWRDTKDEAALHYNPNILMASMFLEKMEHKECNETFGGDVFSCLQAAIFVRRQIGAHLIQTYIPSLIIVIISWASFWIDPAAVPARVTLSFTTLLTLTTQAAGVRMSLPSVDYAQALDYWMGICTMMVFGALLEYTAVNSLLQKAQRAKTKDALNKSKMSKPEVQQKNQVPLLHSTSQNSTVSKQSSARSTSVPIDDFTAVQHKEHYYNHRAYMVEKISRFAFPAVFLLVNIVYWFVLLTS